MSSDFPKPRELPWICWTISNGEVIVTNTWANPIRDTVIGPSESYGKALTRIAAGPTGDAPSVEETDGLRQLASIRISESSSASGRQLAFAVPLTPLFLSLDATDATAERAIATLLAHRKDHGLKGPVRVIANVTSQKQVDEIAATANSVKRAVGLPNDTPIEWRLALGGVDYSQSLLAFLETFCECTCYMPINALVGGGIDQHARNTATKLIDSGVVVIADGAWTETNLCVSLAHCINVIGVSGVRLVPLSGSCSVTTGELPYDTIDKAKALIRAVIDLLGSKIEVSEPFRDMLVKGCAGNQAIGNLDKQQSFLHLGSDGTWARSRLHWDLGLRQPLSALLSDSCIEHVGMDDKNPSGRRHATLPSEVGNPSIPPCGECSFYWLCDKYWTAEAEAFRGIQRNDLANAVDNFTCLINMETLDILMNNFGRNRRLFYRDCGSPTHVRVVDSKVVITDAVSH